MLLRKNVKIFISYSRKDEVFAEYLNKALIELGYSVFYDKEQILVGERFAEKIHHVVRDTDALIFILSDNSVQSEWCKAEVYSFIASGKQFIPLRYSLTQSNLSHNLVLFQRGIHYVEVSEEKDFQNAADKIEQLLSVTRKKVLWKWVLRIMLVFVTVLATGFIFFQLTSRINDWNFDKKRQQMVDKIKSASKLYNREQVELNAADFKNDVQFKTEMYHLSNEVRNSDVLRFNALIFLSYLEEINKASQRWYVNVEWENNKFINGSLNTVSFSEGSIRNTSFINSNFSYIFWGAQLSGVSYKSCVFLANYFDPQAMISVDFENCKFRGGELDLSEMGAVHFYYQPSDSTSSVITEELGLFENCVLINCVPKPEPNVMEILEPDSEVRFSNILFENCHFRGFIRSSWFKKCSFSNCIFPTDINVRELEDNRCTFINRLSSDAACF